MSVSTSRLHDLQSATLERRIRDEAALSLRVENERRWRAWLSQHTAVGPTGERPRHHLEAKTPRPRRGEP